MFSDILIFSIKRSLWNRGKGNRTVFLNDKNERDCFGFYFESCGVKPSDLLEKSEPIDLITYSDQEWRSKFIVKAGNGYYQALICNEIMSANDRKDLSDYEREKLLISLFKRVEVDLSFTD